MKPYIILEGGIHERFANSRAKIQIFAGGYANGKTTGVVIKGLECAKRYPGANILVARSTYPKLNDTIRKEFLEWTPPEWVKRRPTKDDNTLELTNGTRLNFRYISQQGKGKEDESTTSNLLSATYDLIIVDQFDDPQFEYKDFLDLLGRLRGQTPRMDNDTSFPSTGPRWFLITLNPTGNWFYRRVVKPHQEFIKRGTISDLTLLHNDGSPMIDLIEGSTFDNKHNLAADYIDTLAASYQGQMRDRFLLGKWASYEGLIYSQYNPDVHCIDEAVIVNYLQELDERNVSPSWIEGYDYGIAVPSCYLLSFVDHLGNVVLVDGYYKPEFGIPSQVKEIERIRMRWKAVITQKILADPQIFKRTADKKLVGKSIADIFHEEGIEMRRANNDILNGITKVAGYINIVNAHRNPFTNEIGAPHIFFNRQSTEFLDIEISAYMWKKVGDTTTKDEPVDKNDHAMDALKYLMTYRPRIGNILLNRGNLTPAYLRGWMESESRTRQHNPRHAA